MRILVVEDDVKIASALKRGLERQSYAVDVCNDGIEGQAMATAEEYDLVILDRMLPGVDGMGILKSMREASIQTPVLLLTAKEQLVSNIEELDKLTALSDGLLSLARLGNNGLEKTCVALSDIVATAVDTVQSLAEKNKQSIVVSTLTSVDIQANQASMVEAIVTVLENAVKYSSSTSATTISAQKTSRSVNINIKDNGVGIKAVDLPHIFDRFYRADQSRNKTKVGGYGIGLSIAKSTIEAQGGKISVKSSPEIGSTFTITLPLQS